MSLEITHGLEGGQGSRISVDTLPHDFIAGLSQRSINNVYNPLTRPDATNELLRVRDSWRDEGAITILTTGVFDMLHLDHAGYLLHTKAAGASLSYEATHLEESWQALSQARQLSYVEEALSQQTLRLIVSVDGDRSVAIRKGFNPDKGGGVRPVFAWQTRALTVAGQSFVNPKNQNVLLPTVNAVTIHGPDDFSAESPHYSTFNLAAALQPDMWVIFGESQDILTEAPHRKELGGIALHCIEDKPGVHYYRDPFIGKLSTTSVSQRITGNDVQ